MRFSIFKTGVLLAGVCCYALGQTEPAPVPTHRSERKGMPPRATPGDYQAHGPAGPVTVAAEFAGHSITAMEGLLTTEDYIVVEAGLFGPPGARTTLDPNDFSLRVNGKKLLQSQPYEMVFKSAKDPEWEPPEKKEEKSKTSLGTGQNQGNMPTTPPIVHVPIKLQREWEHRIEKSAFPEGDRALPEAGLLFFSYHGKQSGIHSLELIYSGPTGKAKLALQP